MREGDEGRQREKERHERRESGRERRGRRRMTGRERKQERKGDKRRERVRQGGSTFPALVCISLIIAASRLLLPLPTLPTTITNSPGSTCSWMSYESVRRVCERVCEKKREMRRVFEKRKRATEEFSEVFRLPARLAPLPLGPI